MENTNMEAVLQYINSNFVSVADGDVKETNIILAKVLDEITVALRSVSVLFNYMFETYVYGGSFFDGLKVSKPDEFDIDLKLKLPEILDVQLETADKSGFVFMKLKDWKRLTSDTYLFNIYRDLERLKDDDNYLSQEKVKRWMQSIVQQAIDKIREDGTLDDITLSHRMSGPAVTLNVTHNNNNLDIDLVAVFRIPGTKWPASPVRQNTNRVWKDFLVVPKAPKDAPQHPERYWRLSFPEQEREMIRRLNSCKPAIRLLKKLRDTRDHNIVSYFIKTIFLWEIERREQLNDTDFWNTSLTNVFMEMLVKYRDHLEQHEIPYFWNKDNNFLELVTPINIFNIKNYLTGMINTIERRRSTDPFVIAEYLLHADELRKVRTYFANSNRGNIQPQSVSQSVPRTLHKAEINYDESSGSTAGLMQEQPGISTGTMIAGAAAVGIGAALLGLFAYNKNRRNQN